MIKHGIAPYLECSSKGYTPLSAFRARLKGRDNKSIEEIYQAAKIFEDGTTGLHWKEAKGKKAVNMEAIGKLYQQLWEEYFEENPELYEKISKYQGFSDMFGQEGHNCQASTVYNLWVKYQLRKLPMLEEKYSQYIANIKNDEHFDVYCGRAKGEKGQFGNPFTHIPHGTSAIVVPTVNHALAHYRYYLINKINDDPQFLNKVKALKGKVLGCFCKGKHSCHTIFLAALANHE